MTLKSQPVTDSLEQRINFILCSSWLWGTGLTLGFYSLIPYLPIDSTYVQRYFNAYWVEFVITNLFFVGICNLISRYRQTSIETQAMHAGLFDGLPFEPDETAVSVAERIELRLDETAKRFSSTALILRMRDLCEYVIRQRSPEGIESHLQQLHEIDRRHQAQEGGLLRTVFLSILIFGFMGTVSQIAVVTETIIRGKQESLLNEVSAGLTVAFDAMLLSLALISLLTFCKFAFDQIAFAKHAEIEKFVIQQLVGLFTKNIRADNSLPATVDSQLAKQLLLRSEQMINKQLSMWETSLEELRQRWSSTLSKQQDSLDQMLKTGLSNALESHSRELTESRSEFIAAFQQTSESIRSQLAETRSILTEQQQRGSEQIAQTWQQFRTEITKTRDEHARQLALLTQSITAEVGGWQNQLGSSTDAMCLQFQELRTQGEVFLKMSESESQLVRLESRLAENLDAVRVVESLENTLMSLNATVNLLTSRVKFNAA